jgi:hypothetical protein
VRRKTSGVPPVNDTFDPTPIQAKLFHAVTRHGPSLLDISPTPGTGKLSPSRTPADNYDGFTVGIDDSEETGQAPPTRPHPAKPSKVRQKPATGAGLSAVQPLDDQAEIEKLKPKLMICQGC